MTSRTKIPATVKKVKQSKKKIKNKPVYKNNELAEKMSKYFLLSN